MLVVRMIGVGVSNLVVLMHVVGWHIFQVFLKYPFVGSDHCSM